MNVDDSISDGLPLESPRWKELEHAFGEPASTIQLIRELREFVATGKGDYAQLRSRTLDEFGSNLFHQQSRYTATIAAVPHFISLATRLPSELRRHILYDVSWINWLGGNSWIEHHGVNNEFVTGRFVYDEDLITWYDAAISTAAKLAVNALSEVQDENSDLWRQINLLKTACGLNGSPHLANLTHWFEERYPVCPNCNFKLYARYIDSGYIVWDAKLGYDPKSVASEAKFKVLPFSDQIDELHPIDLATLLRYTASPAMNLALEWVKSVHGTFSCPACKHEFRLPEDYGPPTLIK